jgi:uncharacterized protein YggU (UPF0235/DUF167 family)
VTERIRIPVRVKPAASRAGVGGCHDGPFGPALVVAVNAPAVDGRATDAAVRAVARALGVRPADLSVRLGETSRDKLLELADPPAGVAARLQQLLESSG